MTVGTTTTTRLLEGLFDPGADEVWREFDQRYRPIIRGFARRVGLNEEDAADVAQETLTRFVESYRAGKYDRQRGRLRSWIIGIVKRVVAQMRASKLRRRERRGDSAIADLPDEAQLTGMWETERRALILARAMSDLRATSGTSEQTIRAFELVAFEKHSPVDVAGELGVTRHDVYVAKHRVTAKLRAIVEKLNTLYDEEG